MLTPTQEDAETERLWTEVNASRSQPELRTWLAVALQRSLERRPPTVRATFGDERLFSCWPPPLTKSGTRSLRIGAFGSEDPFVSLARSLDEDGGRALLDRALEPTSTTTARQRVLQLVMSDPWLLSTELWQRLLATDWIVEDPKLYPLDALDAASRSFALTTPELGTG